MHAWQMDCLTFTDLIYKTSDSKDVMYDICNTFVPHYQNYYDYCYY